METKNQVSENTIKIVGYHCPMHCEKEKVYNQPGNCPVCNMKLVKVGDKDSSGHHHNNCCG